MDIIYQRLPATGRFVCGDSQFPPGSDVEIEIEQLTSGSTFLYSWSAEVRLFLFFSLSSGQTVSFTGATESGRSIRTSPLRPFGGNEGERDCFSVSHVSIGRETENFDSVELALTNLVFDGSAAERTFQLTTGDGVPLTLKLRSAENYDEKVFHLRQTDYPAVTASLWMALRGVPSLGHLDRLLNEICATLSIVQGRKIQWIQRTAYDPNHTFLWSELGETKTKDHTHSFFCFDPDKQTGIILRLESVVVAFPKVQAFRENYDPDFRIVNSWLDARVQGDFLEARTLKYAIVLEILCRVAQTSHGLTSGYIEKAVWRSAGKKFLPQIKDYLGASLPNDTNAIDSVCSSSNWGNLNRNSFRALVGLSLGSMQVTLHDQLNRIRRVVDVRNKIVHALNYLVAADFEKLTWALTDDVHQHFLVACFVDEVILRLFGLGEHVSESWIAEFRAHGFSEPTPAEANAGD